MSASMRLCFVEVLPDGELGPERSMWLEEPVGLPEPWQVIMLGLDGTLDDGVVDRVIHGFHKSQDDGRAYHEVIIEYVRGNPSRR